MDIKDIRKDYRTIARRYRKEIVPICLTNMQLLEEALKQILSGKNQFIHKLLKDKVIFKCKTSADFRNMPLGQLIDEYKKHNFDTELINDLRAVRKKRDFIAHQAYLMTLWPVDTNNEKWLVRRIDEINSSIKEINKYAKLSLECVTKIQAEYIDSAAKVSVILREERESKKRESKN